MINHAPVRAARPDDRTDFLKMWDDFVALAPDEPGDRAMGARNWERVSAHRNGLSCLVAVDELDRPIGFTLYLAFAFTWSSGDVCYLQDIYVRPEERGRGAAQSMIRHLAAIGAEKGWFKIFWMTQSDNFTAQRLYEKLAQRVDYIRYDLRLGSPG